MTTQINFVLVEPTGAANIGSAARALWTMGFDQLALVKPKADPHSKAAMQMAMDAQFILDGIPVFSSLEEAVANSHWVIGTTHRFRRYKKEYLHPQAFAEWVLGLSAKESVSVLFGPEKSGLSNRDIGLCNKLLTIPAQPKSASLNLAQAVQVVAYELFSFSYYHRQQESIPGLLRKRTAPKDRPATIKHVHGMFDHLRDMLQEVGFLKKQNPEHPMQILQGALNRAQLTLREVRLIRGICRQIGWFHRN